MGGAWCTRRADNRRHEGHDAANPTDQKKELPALSPVHVKLVSSSHFGGGSIEEVD